MATREQTMESWLKENTIECMRFGAVLSPDACKRVQRSNRSACDGCKKADVNSDLVTRSTS